MADNNFLDTLFKIGMTRESFITQYSELKQKQESENPEDAESIFTSDLENTVGAIFDTVDINPDGKLDADEIAALKNYDTSDGEDILSKKDLGVLTEKTIQKLTSEIDIDTPEKMYAKYVTDKNAVPSVNGETTANAYISNLATQIYALNELIALKENQFYTSGKDETSKKLKKKENELKAKNNELLQKEREISAAENEIKYLQSVNDTDDKQNKKQLEKWQKKLNKYQSQYKTIKSTVDTLKRDIASLRADESRFEEEERALKSEIAGYRANIASIREAKTYAIEQSAQTAVVSDYSDADTVEFSGDAQDLKNIWGSSHSDLSDGFYNKVIEISKRIGCDPNSLMAVMQSESGISTKAVNPKGGATGLIQFMPKTAEILGTSTAALQKMSPEQQLVYVEKYLQMTKKTAGFKQDEKINQGQLYTLVFLPAYAKRDVLAVKGHKYYDYNKGLDVDKDGKITMADLSRRVENMKPKSIRKS